MHLGMKRGSLLLGISISEVWLEIICIWIYQGVNTDYAPKTLVKYVRLTNYVDNNLFHGQFTGSYITCILHLDNKTPLGWY